MSGPVHIPPFVLTDEGLQYAPWQPIRVFALDVETGAPREVPLPYHDAARQEREQAIHKAYTDLRVVFDPPRAALMAFQSVGVQVTPEQEAALMGEPSTPR